MSLKYGSGAKERVTQWGARLNVHAESDNGTGFDLQNESFHW